METRCKRIALEDGRFIEKATNCRRSGRRNGRPNNPGRITTWKWIGILMSTPLARLGFWKWLNGKWTPEIWNTALTTGTFHARFISRKKVAIAIGPLRSTAEFQPSILKPMSWTLTDIVTKKWIFDQTEKKRKKEKGNENEKIWSH